ncbi:MAG: hypothetical protein JSV33_08800 [bacterium]|nr:MAG: hypothetical protein JSV33_08800 [bacterium]
MVRRKSRHRHFAVAIAISLVIMALSMSPLAGSPPAKAVLLGSGMLLLLMSMILLQLRLFREGDARKAESTDTSILSHAPSAPAGLKNPRQRTIWSGMEATRSMMSHREEEARKDDMRKEKARLGLTDEEEILYVGNRSWSSFWPIALLSLICVAASTFSSGVTSLILLASGLAGLLLPAALAGSTRYYLTNFRVLVSRRPFPGRKPRWSVLHYRDILRYSARKTLHFKGLRVESAEGTIDITGLNRAQLDTVSQILRKKAPAGFCL